MSVRMSIMMGLGALGVGGCVLRDSPVIFSVHAYGKDVAHVEVRRGSVVMSKLEFFCGDVYNAGTRCNRCWRMWVCRSSHAACSGASGRWALLLCPRVLQLPHLC
jgi:hypothetical protein